MGHRYCRDGCARLAARSYKLRLDFVAVFAPAAADDQVRFSNSVHESMEKLRDCRLVCSRLRIKIGWLSVYRIIKSYH